jgi:hypothetical protein
MGQPSMLRTVGRLIWVPIAFLLSALIALFVIVSLGQERITLALRGRGPNEATIDAAFDLFGLALQLLSVYTLVPAILLIVIGEVARIRTALYYVIGGGLTLAVVPLLAGLNQPASALDVAAVVWQVLATAGFAGGFVYWLLAGRKA